MKRVAGIATGLMVAAAAGCRADYSVDLRNQTPQPVFAQVFERHGDGRTVLLDWSRLGPGDRDALGPVRGQIGRVGLVIDTRPNPQAPYMADLAPGLNIFNVTQKGEGTAGPLEIRGVPR